jgi:hypothetical protein
MTELRIAQCLVCTSKQADDVRHMHGQNAFENSANLSPSGLPMTCCKIRIVVDMPANTSSAAPAPSGGQFSFGGRRSAGGWPPWRQPPLRR